MITITSHCAFEVLPGLSVYGATKAALAGWCDGLRIELSKFGVNVIKFVPGSFVTQSNIMARQVASSFEMNAAFTSEQRLVYGPYFRRYNNYLTSLSGERFPVKIQDPEMYKTFDKVLLDVEPKSTYVHEPWRYCIYHCLFKYTPVPVRDYLVTKFMMMPDYDEKECFDIVSSQD